MAMQAHADLLAQVGEVEGRSLWQDARRRLFRNKAAVVSMVLLLLILLGAVFAPWLSPHPFDEVYWDRIGMPPDYANAHWFGTDNNGRDLFVRRAATSRFGRSSFGRVYGFVYSGLDAGQALSPLVFGPVLDAGRFRQPLIAIALLQAAALLTALRVSSRTRLAEPHVREQLIP